MFHLAPENAEAYLRRPCTAVELGGGVSNTVLLIEANGQRFILKQSLAKLRVEQEWYSDRARVFRESSALRQLAAFLPPRAVPEVLFEDCDNFLFAMTAAPPQAETWKAQLLRGSASQDVAGQAGSILGKMIAATWRDPGFEDEFGDQTVFDQLRIDPYYRSTAMRHPNLAARLAELIAESSRRRFSLVHGDWSPKNLLISDSGVMAIDFEVIHYGDPSFDAAFLLNHLLLKSFYLPRWRSRYHAAAASFWSTLRQHLPQEADWFEAATIRHLGALMLARVDGKSPAEYIREEALKQRIRHFAHALILEPPATIEEVWTKSPV
jgi:5-methylthioribose kinase